MFVLYVNGLEFYGYHGVSDEEQSIGHRYSLSLELDVHGSADRTDLIGDTVDYGAASQAALRAASSQKFRTVERAASHIGKTLLDRFPMVSRVQVDLSKRLPPMDAIADEAGVMVTLDRSPQRRPK